jgi:hypothetical protein
MVHIDTRDPLTAAAKALNAHRWAKVEDRTAATEPARRDGIARYEPIVDPDGTLPADERAQRAKSAYFAELGRLSAQARKARKAAAGGTS